MVGLGPGLFELQAAQRQAKHPGVCPQAELAGCRRIGQVQLNLYLRGQALRKLQGHALRGFIAIKNIAFQGLAKNADVYRLGGHAVQKSTGLDLQAARP